MSQIPVKRALVSVYDKTGLTELGLALHAAGVEIVSTGSTASTLTAAGVPVTAVSDLTGFPEVLDGRVKTLHPKVHAGLLADVRLASHRDQLAELGIAPFELLVSNLYPFRETVASGAGVEETIEQIDIGGPSMVRGAAKNHASVAVVTSPSAYDEIVAAVQAGGTTLAMRQSLAVQAFRHTAGYDIAVASWLGETVAPDESGFPTWLAAEYVRGDVLRYGENPHQSAALYRAPGAVESLATAEQLHGKAMSYNNYVDTDAALRAAYDFPGQTCVAIIKHTNPCGIAVVDDPADIATAHRLANACDTASAFGGVIATNAVVTLAMAEQVAEVFTEVIVAPDFEPAALGLLSRKPSIRILRTGGHAGTGLEHRQVCGGLLVQTADTISANGDSPAGWTLAAGEAADAATLADLAFAWRAVRAVKSNAILLASGGASVGVGMGQVNRVDSARLAVARAGDRAKGSVASSDAFFPFDDGFRVLAEAGVVAVVQPGGSVRDDLTITAAREAGITLYLSGVRHFTH